MIFSSWMQWKSITKTVTGLQDHLFMTFTIHNLKWVHSGEWGSHSIKTFIAELLIAFCCYLLWILNIRWHDCQKQWRMLYNRTTSTSFTMKSWCLSLFEHKAHINEKANMNQILSEWQSQSECSWERILLSAKVPGNKSSRAISLQGAKVPGSESSRERNGQGPTGRFALGSELAQERKGCESWPGTHVTKDRSGCN